MYMLLLLLVASDVVNSRVWYGSLWVGIHATCNKLICWFWFLKKINKSWSSSQDGFFNTIFEIYRTLPSLLFFRFFYSLFCFVLWSVPVFLSLSILSSVLSSWNKDANFFFSFLMNPSYSTIKKYKQQLVDQIKGLETDLDKTASTVREIEVGIYGNPTIRRPCACLSITLGLTPWLWLQMDNCLPPASFLLLQNPVIFVFCFFSLSGKPKFTFTVNKMKHLPFYLESMLEFSHGYSVP